MIYRILYQFVDMDSMCCSTAAHLEADMAKEATEEVMVERLEEVMADPLEEVTVDPPVEVMVAHHPMAVLVVSHLGLLLKDLLLEQTLSECR